MSALPTNTPVALLVYRRDQCQFCPTPCPDGRQAAALLASVCPLNRWEGAATAPLSPELPLPSMLQMATNVTQAAGAETRARLKGEPALSDGEIERRRGICRSNACGQFRPSDERCAACGCWVAEKTAWRSQRCPKELW